jgi:Cu/Ag efflux pump CusA
MGTTVIGGMLAASAIGIFLIPAIFYVVENYRAQGPRTGPDAGDGAGRLT